MFTVVVRKDNVILYNIYENEGPGAIILDVHFYLLK